MLNYQRNPGRTTHCLNDIDGMALGRCPGTSQSGRAGDPGDRCRAGAHGDHEHVDGSPNTGYPGQ